MKAAAASAVAAPGASRIGAPIGPDGRSGSRAGASPAAFSSGRDGPGLLLLAAFLFSLNVFLHYPGTMLNDSIVQYQQAIEGRFTDWHPPVMAWLWSVLRRVGDGPAPFLLVHLAAYWAGFALLADAVRRSGAGHRGLSFTILLAGAFPPFLVMNANVIKDVGMVASWLAAVGLVYWFRAQQRRIPVLGGVLVAVLLTYGTLVRSNAVFGLGPLLLYAVAPAAWLRTGRLITAAMVVALLAVPASQEVNRRLFAPEATSPVVSLFLFDLVGIAAQARDPRLVMPRAKLDTRALQACYTPYWWDSFSPWGRCAAQVVQAPGSLYTSTDGLALQWARTIREHPADYAVHRLKHFNSSLLFAVPLKHSRLAPDFRNDDPAFKPLEVVTDRDIRMDLVRKNPFIWPITWLVWAAALLAFATHEAPARPVLLARVLLVSALGYSCAYLVIGVATDLRYHYWSQIAILSATLVMLPQVMRGLRSRSRALLVGLAGIALVVAVGLATRLLDFHAFAV